MAARDFLLPVPQTPRRVPAFQLLGISLLCAIIGFIGSRVIIAVASQQLHVMQSTRAASMGATVISLSNALPAAAQQPAGVVSSAVTSHLADVADFAGAATAVPDQADMLQIGVFALFIPILGYASWRIGEAKAKQDVAEVKRKFQKDIEEGNYVKFSASGVPTVKGLPMASDAGWKLQCDELRAKGIKGITGEQLKNIGGSGVTIIDVRPADRFKEGAIAGSINIPFFQPIQGWDLFSLARRIQFVIFGVTGTEHNPQFMPTLQKTLETKSGDIIFMDDSVRGTVEPTDAFPDGKPSHALMALYLASNAGSKSTLKYVEGGINEYVKAGGDLIVPEN